MLFLLYATTRQWTTWRKALWPAEWNLRIRTTTWLNIHIASSLSVNWNGIFILIISYDATHDHGIGKKIKKLPPLKKSPFRLETFWKTMKAFQCAEIKGKWACTLELKKKKKKCHTSGNTARIAFLQAQNVLNYCAQFNEWELNENTVLNTMLRWWSDMKLILGWNCTPRTTKIGERFASVREMWKGGEELWKILQQVFTLKCESRQLVWTVLFNK